MMLKVGFVGINEIVIVYLLLTIDSKNRGTLIKTQGVNMNDYVQDIISYEEGLLNDEEVIKLFQDLIDDGIVWQLQCHYIRLANLFIESGYCKLPARKCDNRGGLL